MNRAQRVVILIGLVVIALAWFVAERDLPGAEVALSLLLVLMMTALLFSGLIAGAIVWTLTWRRLPLWLAGCLSLLVVVGVYWLVGEGLQQTVGQPSD